MAHPFDNEFSVAREQMEHFSRDGFVKLKGFLNADVVSTLLDRVDVELNRGMEVQFNRGTTDRVASESVFSRTQYDFAADKADIFELLERPYFRRALTDLTGRDLFLTFELSFEIKKNVNKGFPWHVGVQSFGYQFAEEFACTLWVPLHPIDTNGQRGGMAYIPQHILPGDFVYPADLAVVEALKARERAGKRTGVDDYFGLRGGILNSPAMKELLDVQAVEDDFEPGDAFLFNKSVIHRSVLLGEGELAQRAAYVMRFVDATSRYDLNRAQCLEFPSEQYGKGPFPYKPVTRQHIEIAEAGAQHGDVISQCAYFSDRDRRTIRRNTGSRAS
ncbi:MAG: phytanoyl-CoA dioxygenase family protein [Gemmatimonadales bacterium]|nr:phytanoyl-CoA dioxygenase family protein [Gemmatimonadales bacterium]MYG48292.1 phytanoyl-CoA dioxygenase family protein [Gemmatimonadales bacterium]MYK02573.1 phytanoyl-CoA dioxygenase family protein [Candidatus Palauibacter ramosifaciens]